MIKLKDILFNEAAEIVDDEAPEGEGSFGNLAYAMAPQMIDGDEADQVASRYGLDVKHKPKDKESELHNGGPVYSGMLGILADLESLSGFQLKITGGNDRFHQDLSQFSHHKTGYAVDIVSPSLEVKKNRKFFEKCILKLFLDGDYEEGGKALGAINEYDKPTGHATGGHFHISYTSSGKEFNLALLGISRRKANRMKRNGKKITQEELNADIESGEVVPVDVPSGDDHTSSTPGVSHSGTYNVEYRKDVKDAQIILYELGYDLGPYGEMGEGKDGKLGPYTSEALKQFQIYAFIDKESWTGKLTDETKEKLQSLPAAEKLVIQKENNKDKAEDLVAKTDVSNTQKTNTSNVYYNKLPADVKKAVDKLRRKGVNITDHHLKREFDQEGSTQPDLGENRAAEKAAKQLVDAIRAQFPDNREVQKADGLKSGYRSYNAQVKNFARKVKKGRSIDNVQAANTIPGFSQHHTGKAFDILSTESSWWSRNRAVAAWVEKNAPKYGFEVTYKKKGVLRIAEPWHLFYTK